MKRTTLCLTITGLLLSAAATAALAEDADDARITTIVGLNNIQQIGSTQNINDANGKPIMVDPDPYKIAIVQEKFGKLKRGTLLVSNIGNDLGTTIVKFNPFPSIGVQFNAATAGLQGPAEMAFDRDHLLVANSKGGNSVQVLNPNGTLLMSITDPLFNNPWGLATGFTRGGGQLGTFFVANKSDAKVLRVDVQQQTKKAAPSFKVTQIAQLPVMADGPTKIDLKWLPFFRVGAQFMFDVLVLQDPATNRIAAIPNASKLNTSTGTGTTIFQGKPLNVPGGLAINPLNGDILVVNLNDNNMVEINPEKATVVGVKTVDPLVVDNQGNNSALFGVLATTDKRGNLLVFYTDDNTNTLNALSAAPLFAPKSSEN
jgi:DNA-binding beta-propeller fold protein YncE